ncbi:MAG: hypothetical protein UW41_C0037G0010 [Candidatus Collierbacteria bacterium GW2011_GWC2_44_18]|uniref:Uncharacterized protein n=1 Tax=Candidatus Collierbacteria bacterium GW2011_GWC2_44_18 TaxID=1618392 RepID=A0A0G1HMU1_9BACT|nr:MAG: hypothetical protein UW41_C0037G0010 [Candidatus Collierbacteria bacterium GW2011_GWC2_44_18]
MRTSSVGKWKSPQTMDQIASRMADSLAWQKLEDRANEQEMIQNGTVPQFVSPLGHDDKGTALGRIIEQKTSGRPLTWDERSAEQQKEIAEQIKADKKRAKELKELQLQRLQDEIGNLVIN